MKRTETHFIKKLNKEVQGEIVQEWTSRSGEKWVSFEYFNPEYNIHEITSFMVGVSEVSENTVKVPEPEDDWVEW